MTGDGAKPPISAHPAFPAIVALWFAALLGFGSLVLPAALFEAFFAATGVSNIVPSAAPPLGFTARSLIALLGGVTGALVGLVIARRIALAHAPQGEPRFDPVALTGGRRKPLLAHDDLDEAGIAAQEGADASTEFPKKRRSLAMAEESSRSYYLDHAPLPGHDLHVSAAAAEALTADSGDEERDDAGIPVSPSHRQGVDGMQQRQEFVAPPPSALQDESADSPGPAAPPLELGEFAEDSAPTDDPKGGDHDIADPALAPEQRQEFGRQDFSMTDTQQFKPFEHSPPAEAEPDDFGFASQAKPGKAAADPLPFAAPSLQRKGAPLELEEPIAEDEPQLAPTAEFAAPQLTAVPDTDEDEKPASPLGEAPLDELGLVQLAERLGMSIEKRRAWIAESRTAAQFVLPVGGLNPQALEEAAAPEDAARAMAAYFGAPNAAQPTPAFEEHDPTATPSSAPAALQEFLGEEEAGDESPLPADASSQPAPPLDAEAPSVLRGLEMLDQDDDEDEDGDIAASLSLPLGGRAFDRPRPLAAFEDTAAETDDADEEEGVEDEDDYSSLLAMKNPFERKPEFVRIEEPELEDDDVEPTVRFPNALRSAAASGAEERPFDRPSGVKSAPPTAAASPAFPARAADPGETERDLRSALSALQRMSGAA